MELGPFAIDSLHVKAAAELSATIALIDGQPFVVTVVPSGKKAFYPLSGDDPYIQSRANLGRRPAMPVPAKLEIVVGLPEAVSSSTFNADDPEEWPLGWLVVAEKNGACLSVLAHEGEARRFTYLIRLSDLQEVAGHDLGTYVFFRDWRLFGVTPSGERFQIPLASPSKAP